MKYIYTYIYLLGKKIFVKYFEFLMTKYIMCNSKIYTLWTFRISRYIFIQNHKEKARFLVILNLYTSIPVSIERVDEISRCFFFCIVTHFENDFSQNLAKPYIWSFIYYYTVQIESVIIFKKKLEQFLPW